MALGASAQESARLSFTASPTLNWMKSGLNQISKGKTIVGFDFGLNADIYFDRQERYALTTGLLVSNTGGELDYYLTPQFEFAGEILSGRTSIRYHLQYIVIPLAIKLKTSLNRRWNYWGQFGVSNYINIKAKGDSNTGVLNKTDINEEVNLFNMALNVGVGSLYDLGDDNFISVGLIYKNGFTDVTTNNYFKEKTTINSLMLNLGLVF